ncbi:MAG: metal-dependent hydrolase [Ferroplasma sp.]|uniref:metal-dependent hydrolase n=1 Tax=Ferroplasma sp. TaxID=2591003 RepID=UPI0028156E32|nr:metal-dependent hydrolase [Ferroplasma sp.]WMT50923.1 MAG: metal-dependent hydrolase [Ferroplasma sp.]
MTTEIIWHGHAGFSIKGSTEVLVDPFFSGNPLAKEKAEDMNPDIIAVTHGHFDHAGDAVAISRKNNIPILCSFELSEILKKENAQTIDINPGGTVEFQNLKISAVPAIHSSSYNGLYAGASMGYIIDNGDVKIYHAGDTTYFKDMELIGSVFKPDIAMLPIGGHYTMDIDGAVEAIKLLGVKKVIPMHYNTFPPIKADASEFKEKAELAGAKVTIPEPGKSFTF